MPDVADQPSTPPRTWRPMVAWTVGILLTLGLVWLIAAFIVTVRETRSVLARFAWYGAGGAYGPGQAPATLSPEESIRILGGPERAIFKLRIYLQLPRRQAPNQAFAASLLGYCGKQAVPSLVSALRHANGGVRRYAISSLGQIGPDAAPAVPELMRFLSSEEGLDRSHAAEALGKIGPAAGSAVPELEKLHQDKDTTVRTAAAEALKKIKGEEQPK